MNTITHLDIDASPATVWAALTDFDRYPEWHPVLRELDAELEVGAPVRIVAQMGRRTMTMHAVMVRVDFERELGWRGPRSRVGRFFFGAHHWFRLEPRPGGGTAVHLRIPAGPPRV